MDPLDIDPSEHVWAPRSPRGILRGLQQHRQAGQILIIGIDGHSGSGKTTVASRLGEVDPSVAVIHTDDIAWHHSFFDWTPLLIDAVLVPLRCGTLPVSHRPDAWIQRHRKGAITVPDTATTVLIEGVGAGHRDLRPFLDALIWVYARPETGRRRVLSRGVDTEQFILDWLAQEDAMLAQHRPWQCATLLVHAEQTTPNGDLITAAGPVAEPR